MISRDARLIEPHTYGLSSNERYRYILANLHVLASIQKFSNTGPLPNLTEWIVSAIEPVVERYHDTRQQKKITENISKEKSLGDLSKILEIVESPNTVKKDQINYKRAIAQYKNLETEKKNLTTKMEKPKYFAERTGREWAATLSGIISTLIIIGFLIVHYSEGGP